MNNSDVSDSKEKNTTASKSMELQDTLSGFIPYQTLKLIGDEKLLNTGDHVEKNMTVFFSDIRGFTTISENMTTAENFSFINAYLSHMEPIVSKNNGIIDKYMGDGIMAIFPKLPDDAINCAIEMISTIESLNNTGKLPDIRIGAGLNTGIMMLGLIGGRSRIESTVISDAVNLAARIESINKAYSTGLLISEHTYYKLENPQNYHIRFIDRITVKGKKQPQSIYEVFDADKLELKTAKAKTKKTFEEALALYHFKEPQKAINLLDKCLLEAPDDSVAKVYKERCEKYIKAGKFEGTLEFDLKVRWTKEVEVGIAAIDKQHQELFVSTQQLVDSVKDGAAQQSIEQNLNNLAELVEEHFNDEEEYMQTINYPFLQLQKDEHKRFLNLFGKLKDEICNDPNQSRAFLLFKIQLLLIDWLINHTSKLDKHLIKFAASNSHNISK